MEQQNEKEGERSEEASGGKEGGDEGTAEMSRKEKRKAMKKMKRKQVRKEIAEKEREEAEAKLNDPAEQERLKAIEEEEARMREKELKEFEESERAWKEAMEMKRKKQDKEEAEREEEERRWKDINESRKLEANGDDKCGEDEDGEYEYIEEGPPEIIFQGNEIILRKNKVKVPKRPVIQVDGNEISDRPTSNPLPPETEAFPNYQNVSSAQQILDKVAQEVPNFGTEQDKAHCPFHMKTGACRFGPRCSRVHFYPDKSCTLLMKNMYNGPGIAWEQDEGLEYTDEEAERCYEEFYEDVHTEFLKYGELINFKVCRNGSFHLKGNVYVHYRSLESAILAYQSINGRYFASKPVKCEFVNISRWKVAICGEYMKSRLKTCSRGSACNFIHCFRNPGGDYEWADHDKPPPRFWIHKMTALFGSSDEFLNHMEHEYSKFDDFIPNQPTDSHRQLSRRSRSRDKPSYRSHGETRGHKLSRHVESSGDGDESPGSSYCETKWSEQSPGHRATRKRIHGRYLDDSDGNDRRETDQKQEARRSTDSEESIRTRSKHRHGRSSSRYLQDEDHHPDKISDIGDDGENYRRRSVEFDKEKDKSKQRHKDKSRDSDCDRSRKGKRHGGRSGNGGSLEQLSPEVKEKVKRENVSGLSSEESLEREKQKGRSHRHKRRRRRSRHSHESEEVERWRPM